MIEPGKDQLTEAVEGQAPAPAGAQGGPHGPSRSIGPGATPREVAESTRRSQEARDNGKTDLDRDDHLVRIGRGQQTHG